MPWCTESDSLKRYGVDQRCNGVQDCTDGSDEPAEECRAYKRSFPVDSVAVQSNDFCKKVPRKCAMGVACSDGACSTSECSNGFSKIDGECKVNMNMTNGGIELVVHEMSEIYTVKCGLSKHGIETNVSTAFQTKTNRAVFSHIIDMDIGVKNGQGYNSFYTSLIRHHFSTEYMLKPVENVG